MHSILEYWVEAYLIVCVCLCVCVYAPYLVFQLENLMYYTENNHNKVVLRDFYLSKFENGSITEPCGTPEYLGTFHRHVYLPRHLSHSFLLYFLALCFDFCLVFHAGTSSTLLFFLRAPADRRTFEINMW